MSTKKLFCQIIYLFFYFISNKKLSRTIFISFKNQKGDVIKHYKNV